MSIHRPFSNKNENKREGINVKPPENYIPVDKQEMYRKMKESDITTYSMGGIPLKKRGIKTQGW